MDEPETNDDFGLGFDDQDKDDSFAGEVLEKRVDSLSWKVTLLAIVVPCLIVVIAVLAYFNITEQVTDLKASRSAAVKEFTHIYEEKLANLKQAQQDLQNKLGSRLQKMEDRVAAADRRAESAVKTAKKEAAAVASSVQSLGRKLNDLKQQMAETADNSGKLAERIKTLQADFDKVDRLSQKLQTIEKSLAAKADEESVAQRLAAAEKRLKEALQTASNRWQKQLDELAIRVDDLEKTLAAGRQTGSGSKSDSSAPLEGTIIEEDLSE